MIKMNDSGVKYFVTLDELTRLHVSNGNKKLGKGIYTVNLLPGEKPITAKGQRLTNVRGTCAGCCENCENCCYAINDARYHNNTVIPATAENTLLAIYETETFFRELDVFTKRNIVSVIRFHSSGEIPNAKYFGYLVQFATDHPDIKIYTYTKRFSIVNEFLAENDLPENLFINLSMWHKNIDFDKYPNLKKLPLFVYDDGAEPELENVPHCPAVAPDGTETGITCAQCRKCFTRHNDNIAVYAH